MQWSKVWWRICNVNSISRGASSGGDVPSCSTPLSQCGRPVALRASVAFIFVRCMTISGPVRCQSSWTKNSRNNKHSVLAAGGQRSRSPANLCRDTRCIVESTFVSGGASRNSSTPLPPRLRVPGIRNVLTKQRNNVMRRDWLRRSGSYTRASNIPSLARPWHQWIDHALLRPRTCG